MPNNIKPVLPIQNIATGECTHVTNVTKILNWWHCRVYLNGRVNQEVKVRVRDEIGLASAHMLRIEDKCGNHSDMAKASRFRDKSISRKLNVINGTTNE